MKSVSRAAHWEQPGGRLSSAGAHDPRARRAPDYEALDGQGLPYVRPAQCICELPTPQERGRALESATMEIARVLNSVAQRRIGFGTPVHIAFGMTRQAAKNHAHAKILLMKGDAVPLSWCGCFTP